MVSVGSEVVSVEDNQVGVDILMPFSKHIANDVEISICYTETNILYH